MTRTSRWFLTLCFLIVVPGVGHAKALSIADLERQGASLKTWQADFTQITTVEALDDDVQKLGAISVEKPKKFSIRYTSTPEKTYLYDGKKLWVHQIQSATVLEYAKPESLISGEALSFLSGLENLSALFTEADANEIPEYDLANNKLKTIALKPLSDNASLSYLVIAVDNNLDTREAFVWTPSGNSTHYIFSNIKKNEPLDSAQFSWTDRKGVKRIKQ